MASARGKLARYRAKRDFGRTAEPSGAQRPAPGRRFVIQQHAARRMHYDFRLELDGVLLSWSVPKGPSLSPKTRRLAVRTEDHPTAYADFEGIIPKGEYGGGAVAVWDHGTWQPEGDTDAQAAVKAGKLRFTLAGEKLHGRWHLVRTKPQGKQESWLLFKGRDDAADDKLDVVAAKPASVLSGRTIDQIAAAPDAVWRAKDAEPSDSPSANLREALGKLQLGFELTNLDKILYADQGITKGQLVGYFAAVAPWLLAHAGHRPLMAIRCPNGQGRACFVQKHALASAPAAIARVPIPEEDAPYMAVDDRAGLVALALLGTLEVHTWGARTDDVEHPDLLVLDLDPDVDLKEFAKSIAEQLASDQPAAYTSNMVKAQRKGRVFVDYLRNARGATFVAPYSPRARPGAPIATPITWDELAAGVDPTAFTLRTLPVRLESLARDPWDGFFELDQSIA